MFHVAEAIALSWQSPFVLVATAALSTIILLLDIYHYLSYLLSSYFGLALIG